MKKIILFCILCISMVFVGCSNSNVSTDKSKDTNKVESSTDSKKTSDTTKDDSFDENAVDTTDSSSQSEKTIRVYLYDAVDDKIVYTDSKVKVKDGALTTAIIEDLKIQKGPNYFNLESDVAVNSASLDKANDTLTVNFGEKFINNMNLGSGIEDMSLKSVVNTLGYNYGVSKVIINVNGSPYSSGHISMESGEAFNVDYDGCTSLQ